MNPAKSNGGRGMSCLPLRMAILLCLMLPVSAAHAERREIRLTGPQITRQLASAFPLRRCLFGELACIQVRQPNVTMEAGDARLFVSVALGFQPVPGEEAQHGTARFAGQPVYDVGRGAFYLKHPKLLGLSLPGVSAQDSHTISSVISGLLEDEFFSRQPLWVLDESDPRQALARLSLRSLSVQQGALVITFGDDDPTTDDNHGTPGDDALAEPSAPHKASPAKPSVSL
ncbi:MAG: DUF1439 domain-containing protein [Lautropia sp.]|nr:DUF1439 domain-containing protein [Lautropia sp.]